MPLLYINSPACPLGIVIEFRTPLNPPAVLLKIIKRWPALGAAGAVMDIEPVAVPVNCTKEVFAELQQH